MSRITEKDLQGRVSALNSAMGYKGISWNKRLGKYVGKGFLINSAYGGYKCSFANYSKGSGERDVTYGYVSKRELYDEMSAMIRAVLWYKQRTKY